MRALPIASCLSCKLKAHFMSSHFLASVSALAVLAAPAFAQVKEADQPAGWTPDIVVTGTRDDYRAINADVLRTPVPIQETPQSIQLLTRRLLEDQQVVTLSEALTNVSGVVASLPSEMLLANPIIRGFEAEIFTDGLIGYADTAVSDPGSLWHVERIEVAKGPTSTLYGGGTGAPVGGLINQVTRSANGTSGFAAQLRGGSYSSYAIAGDGRVALSDTLSARVVAEYVDADDYIDTVTQSRFIIVPSLRFAPGEATSITAKLNYSRVAQLEYAGLPAFLVDNAAVKRNRFTGATDAPRSEIENLSIDVDARHKISDSLTANVRVRRYTNDFTEYATSPFLALFRCSGTVCPVLNGILPASVREWTGDASLTATVNTGPVRHVILAGVQHDATNYRAATGFDFFNLFPFDYANPAADFRYSEPAIGQRVTNRYRTTAAYLQNQMTIAYHVHLLASIRYSRLSIKEIEGGQGNDEVYNELDPRIGVSVDVAEGINLFAGYATGSRLSLFFNDTNVLPERSESMEAGLKFALTDIGLTGNIAAFSIERSNVPTPNPNRLGKSIQTGKQKSEGVEVDFIYEPSRAISLLATYAYTDARVTEDTLIPPGAQLPRAPAHRGRIAARYRWLDGALAGLELGGGMTASSGAYMTLPNVARTDGYVIFDAQASFDFGPAKLGLRLDNLLNKKYVLPYQYFAQDVVRPGNPRSALITLSTDF
jgi:iron complex outermembrane recepter protein